MYDSVAISRKYLPTFATTSVDTMIQLDINLHADNLLTQVTVHVPTVEVAAVDKLAKVPITKCRHPSRASLELPEVRQEIEASIATMPPPHPTWTVDEHDRLLTKLFRGVWFRHGITVPSVPHSPWTTSAVWTSLQEHAATRRCNATALREEAQVAISIFLLAWRYAIYRWSTMLPFANLQARRARVESPIRKQSVLIRALDVAIAQRKY